MKQNAEMAFFVLNMKNNGSSEIWRDKTNGLNVNSMACETCVSGFISLQFYCVSGFIRFMARGAGSPGGYIGLHSSPKQRSRRSKFRKSHF